MEKVTEIVMGQHRGDWFWCIEVNSMTVEDSPMNYSTFDRAAKAAQTSFLVWTVKVENCEV
jgi:hypothetical protein